MKRWINAPNNISQTKENTVLGVLLDTNEDVEWIYTILPDGKRIITGYEIHQIISQDQEETLEKHFSL